MEKIKMLIEILAWIWIIYWSIIMLLGTLAIYYSPRGFLTRMRYGTPGIIGEILGVWFHNWRTFIWLLSILILLII